MANLDSRGEWFSSSPSGKERHHHLDVPLDVRKLLRLVGFALYSMYEYVK